MGQGLFITNKVDKNTFAYQSSFKYSDYFKENGWDIAYIEDNLNSINFSTYSYVILWTIQESSTRHMKKYILFRLIALQAEYNFNLLDYVEDAHQLEHFFDLDTQFYKKNFKEGTKKYIIVRYNSVVEKYFLGCNCYILHFSVDHGITPRFNTNPVKRILLTGDLARNAYPLRVRISELQNRFPIDVLPHPGYYGAIKHTCVGKSYINKLSEYLISVSTCASSDYNYMVAKYFEIPASGALLFAYSKPIAQEMEQLGFRDMVNYISFDADNLIERLEYVLDPDNLDEVNMIRRNGYDLVASNHTHQTRFFKEFHKFLQSLSHLTVAEEHPNP
jgi:hypothetical protein